MSPTLEEVFGELCISQYLGAFVDQGFDTWETILDITESDLDALGVKLGHRRKLQRRIANYRGIAPDAALVSPTRPSIEDATARPEVLNTDAPPPSSAPAAATPAPLPTPAPAATDTRDGGAVAVQKRKYRRHPKPDENAPERPPSAYVLFSNKMREDLKGQNLTFTEIAKLVGENWQSLGQVEKEPFETQAQNAKDKYNQDLAEYKKTVDYRNYLEYLQEFKAKHSHHSQEKEVTKRVRLTETNGGEHHTNRLSRARRAGSLISDAGGEPPVRRQRIGSTVSNGESQYSASVVSAHQLTPGDEHLVLSPGTGYFDRGMDEQSPGCYVGSPRDGSSQPASGLHTLRREPAYVDAARNEASGPPRHLPSFSDMFDGRPMSNGLNPSSVEAAGPTFGVFPRGHQTASPVPTPSLSGSDSRPPSLRKEQSSAGSISSGSSYSYPRTPIEGPLPIHALLAGGGKPMAPYEAPYNGNPALRGRSMSPDERNNQMQYSNGPERMPSDTSSNGFPMPHINGYYSGATPNANPPSAVSPPRSSFSGPAAETRPVLKQIQRHSGGKRPADMDGISALLQADKIVDRGAH